MSEIKDIPKHWEIKKLGEVCGIVYGKGLPVKELKTSGFPVFGANGVIGFNDKYLFEEPQVLISCRGAASGKINLSPPKCYVTNNSLVLDIKHKNELDRNYLFYALSIAKKTKLVTGTAQPQVTINNAVELEICYPPLAEQQAIVAKIEELLSELDNGKQQLLTAQQQLKVYRQSLLKWAFEGKLSVEWRKKQTSLPSSIQLLEKIKRERKKILNINRIKIKPIQTISEEEIEELPKLPNGSIWVKLGEILWSVKDGPHYSPKYQEHGIPFISGGNIRPNGIDFGNVKYISNELHIELSKRCRPMKMDVLYTKGGTTGIAKVNDYDIDFNVWVHVAVLKAIPSINPYYLQHALNSNHCYKQSQKYTHGVGNQDLGLTRMVLITLPICSLEEQNYIVSELESKLTVCDKIEETISQSLQQAETLRQSILKKAFEGRLV